MINNINKTEEISGDKVPSNQENGKKNRRYSQEKRKSKIRQNKKDTKIRKKKELAKIKKNLLNQNAINLTNIQLSQHQQSLSKKGPSFLPSSKDVDWFNLHQDFDKVTNQLRSNRQEHQKKQKHQHQ